jgi:hypothetical protein
MRIRLEPLAKYSHDPEPAYTAGARISPHQFKQAQRVTISDAEIIERFETYLETLNGCQPPHYLRETVVRPKRAFSLRLCTPQPHFACSKEQSLNL